METARLVLLCDTSGSMEAHTRFLLAFVRALRRVADRTEVFAFNTELVRITPWMAVSRLAALETRLREAVPDWSGGTRIGECLAEFVDRHLSTLVDSRTAVVVLSDGLDRGDPAVLGEALRRIRARARRVLWLNPLAGDPGFEPSVAGMAAALPHLDLLAPACHLASLERLLPRRRTWPMAFQIVKTFAVKAPPDAVWRFLIDPRKVAGCMPGAAITNQVDDRTFTGPMTVKVGPVTTRALGRESSSTCAARAGGLPQKRSEEDPRHLLACPRGKKPRGFGSEVSLRF